MRLINVETKRLENFYGDPSVPYAILSHTWGKEEEELSFQDLQSLNERGTGRTAKLDGTCARAQRDGLKYAWIDTCCIDKTNAVELSEAITSMFRWYKKSAMCYTYLSDVKEGGVSQIRNSRWFTRGWTLQELLASPKITFFDSSWRTLGTKSSLSGVIIEATGIPHHILSGFASLDSASIAQKFHWVSKRTTTRPEDMAYCMFGIFDIAIPPLYGEGLELAFERLQEAIMRKSPDDSILAWDALIQMDTDSNQTLPAVSGGVLASSPAAFSGCGNIIQRGQTDTRIRASETAWGTIPISICLRTEPSALPDCHEPLVYGYLSCGPRSEPSLAVAIPLIRCHQDLSNSHGPPVYLRPRGSKAICLPKSASKDVTPVTILIRKDRAQDSARAEDKAYWFYLPGPYPRNGTIDEVYPADSYEKDMAMITTPRELQVESMVYLIRLSYTPRDAEILGIEAKRPRFILALEFYPDSARGQREPLGYLYFDARPEDSPTPLSKVADMWQSISQSRTNHIHSHSEPLTIKVEVEMDTIAGHPLWSVRLSDHELASKLLIPRGWPEISEQIRLRRHGISLVEHMHEAAELSQQYGNIQLKRSQLRHHEERLAETLGEVQAKIEELASELEGQLALERCLKDELSYVSADREAHTSFVELYNSRVGEFAKTRDANARGRDVRRVWFGSRLPAIPGTVLPGSEWEEARRQERNGIVAFIMQHHPLLLHNGERLQWVPGMTLLMYAVASGDLGVINSALSYDDDIEACDSLGRTIFDWARLFQAEPGVFKELESIRKEFKNKRNGGKSQDTEQNHLVDLEAEASMEVGGSGPEKAPSSGDNPAVPIQPPGSTIGARAIVRSLGGDAEGKSQRLPFGNGTIQDVSEEDKAQWMRKALRHRGYGPRPDPQLHGGPSFRTQQDTADTADRIYAPKHDIDTQKMIDHDTGMDLQPSEGPSTPPLKSKPNQANSTPMPSATDLLSTRSSPAAIPKTSDWTSLTQRFRRKRYRSRGFPER